MCFTSTACADGFGACGSSVDFALLQDVSISSYMLMYVCMFASKTKLRRSQPDVARPIRITGLPVIAVVGVLAAVSAIVLGPPTDLWALRCPDHHRLLALRRSAGGHLDGGLRGRSDHPDWRLMESGEVLRVGPDLATTSSLVLPNPPARRSVDPLPCTP